MSLNVPTIADVIQYAQCTYSNIANDQLDYLHILPLHLMHPRTSFVSKASSLYLRIDYLGQRWYPKTRKYYISVCVLMMLIFTIPDTLH